MPSMTEITCKCGCGRTKLVRTADVKRGWGLYFSKRCKAVEQERRTGQHRARQSNYRGSGVSREEYESYANEFGGTPQFSRSGEYLGFTDGTFDNTSCQNSDPHDA